MKKIVATSLLASLLLFAEETPLTTHTEFGFIDTKGNTNTTSYALEATAKKSIDAHSLEFKFDGQYAQSDNVTNKNKFALLLDYDYGFSKTLAISYIAGYKRDKFSGFKYQLFTGPGLKYKAYKSEKQDLNFDASILYSRDVTEDDYNVTPPQLSVTNNYGAFRATASYNVQLLENLKFAQDLSYRVDLEDGKNYFIFSKSSFSSKLSDIFSAGINYKVDYVNQPPAGKTYTDRTLTATLIVDY